MTLLRLDPHEKMKQDFIFLNSTWKSPETIFELPTESNVDNKLNGPSILKNTDHVDFNDKKQDNVTSNKVNSIPTLEEHLTPKIYVDNAVSDVISNVDNLHEIDRNRQDLSSALNDQDSEFDNNILISLDSITANRDPSSDNELANKKYVEDSIGEGYVLRVNQTLENYLKVSVRNDVYILTKYDKIQIIDTTFIKYPKKSGYLLQNWVIKCNDKKIMVKYKTL